MAAVASSAEPSWRLGVPIDSSQTLVRLCESVNVAVDETALPRSLHSMDTSSSFCMSLICCSILIAVTANPPGIHDVNHAAMLRPLI
jgi:hypothetical protein